MSLLSDLGERNIQAHKRAAQFRNTFGRGLNHYWNPLIGFDLCKFDDQVVKPPDGTSTRQQIKKTWGIEAVKLIEALIKL